MARLRTFAFVLACIAGGAVGMGLFELGRTLYQDHVVLWQVVNALNRVQQAK